MAKKKVNLFPMLRVSGKPMWHLNVPGLGSLVLLTREP
jgi:hypothetical protein